MSRRHSHFRKRLNQRWLNGVIQRASSAAPGASVQPGQMVQGGMSGGNIVALGGGNIIALGGNN